jgi:molybdopterin molybdotransferase
MLTVEDALARILRRADPVDVEAVATLAADGRVLAVDVVSALAVPPLDNSQMEVTQCGHRLAAPGTTLRVSQRIAADVGWRSTATARIFTNPGSGGCGCDRRRKPARPVKDASRSMKCRNAVRGSARLASTSRQRYRGAAGAWLRPQDLGLIVGWRGARDGASRLQVACSLATNSRCRVNRAPGRIYNSNASCCVRCWAPRCDERPRHRSDDRARAAFVDAAGNADLILTSGGVSVGEKTIKPAVEAEGALELWQIA